MPEDRQSIRESIANIAMRKQRAAETRFGRGPVAVEAPKEVYDECCQLIAKAFEVDGYRYSKSAKCFTSSKGDFKFQISFQSSRNNVADEYVALWIHANVLSPTLKKWRAEHKALRTDFDHVAGGQIGNLRKETAWLEWNLARPSTREQQIEDAIRHIRDIALPYFAVFDDIKTACAAFVERDFPATCVADIIDFLLCFSGPKEARLGASNFLARRSDLVGAYGRALERFSSKGIPTHVLTAHAETLAAASIIYDFGDLRTATG
jgi:hypothetical protein